MVASACPGAHRAGASRGRARAPASRRGCQGHLQCLAPGSPPEQLPLAHCMFRLHGAPEGSLRSGRCGPLRHTPSLQFREAHCRSNSQCAPTGSLARLDVASSMIRVPPSMRPRSIVPPVSLSTCLVADELRYRYLRPRSPSASQGGPSVGMVIGHFRRIHGGVSNAAGLRIAPWCVGCVGIRSGSERIATDVP